MTATAAAAPSESASKMAVAYDSPEEFGKALARAVNARDLNLVADFFDVHAFALRVGQAASNDARSQERIATDYERSGVVSLQPLNTLEYPRRESMHLVAGFRR